MKTCVCNNCGLEIEIHVQEEVIDQDKNGNDIVKQFFICPECGTQYIVFILDQFMKQKIAARKRLKKMPRYYNPTLDTALMKEMQKHFKMLKKRYGLE